MLFALAAYAMLGAFFYALFFVGARADTLHNTGDDLANCGWFKTPTDEIFPFHSREF